MIVPRIAPGHFVLPAAVFFEFSLGLGAYVHAAPAKDRAEHGIAAYSEEDPLDHGYSPP